LQRVTDIDTRGERLVEHIALECRRLQSNLRLWVQQHVIVCEVIHEERRSPAMSVIPFTSDPEAEVGYAIGRQMRQKLIRGEQRAGHPEW
jgi:hypothetical protein